MARIDTNFVIIDGVLGADAKRYDKGGQPKVVFTLGSNGRSKIAGEFVDHRTWIPCVMWGEFGGRIAADLRKGTWVQVQGHLRTSNDGEKPVTEVVVKHLVLPPWAGDQAESPGEM